MRRELRSVQALSRHVELVERRRAAAIGEAPGEVRPSPGVISRLTASPEDEGSTRVKYEKAQATPATQPARRQWLSLPAPSAGGSSQCVPYGPEPLTPRFPPRCR
jgi:hypothetical protein